MIRSSGRALASASVWKRGKDDDLEDALAAIEQFRHWIANTDTKAGFLVASVSVLLGALTGQRGTLDRHLPPDGALDWVGVGLLAASGLATLLAAFVVARVLLPRIVTTKFSRYSWPSVAAVDVDKLVRLGPDGRRREAWTTAKALADIARTKIVLLRLGVRLFLTGAALLVLALAVLAA